MIKKGPTTYISGIDSIGPRFKVITLSGSATQTFPSGLIRYDRTYLVEKKNEQAAQEYFQMGNLLLVGINRGIYESSPFIFPDPKQVSDVPGFIKFVVTAYSKSNDSEFRETFNQQQVNLSKGFRASIVTTQDEPPVNYSWSVLEKWLVDSVTTSGVAPSGEQSVAGTKRILNFRLIRRIVSGAVAPGGQRSLEIDWSKESVSIVRRNFGRWTEYDHTETLIPYY
jgi:hypothetical protein